MTVAAPPERTAPPKRTLLRDLTLFGTVALVAGNMLGTSLYTLPASVAAVAGPIGIVSWIITAAGFLLLALLYSELGPRYPRTGGPYVFAREAFGEFAGFQTVWMYWLSAVVGNAAIVTGAIGYAVAFSPRLASSHLLQFLLAQGVVWLLCAINILGVKQSARVQKSILLINIIPLVLLSLALFKLNPANFHPFHPKGTWTPVAAGSALMVWAYAGIESATVPAEEMQTPQRTIRLGTLLGYGLATMIFLLSAVAVIGALPNDVIASSARPLELAVRETLGTWPAIAVSVAAIGASIGVLNGWILMAGRIPFSAAQDGLFFSTFARVHPRFGTPYVALIGGCVITSAMLTLYFIPGSTLLGVFNFTVLLANLGTLFPYLYNSAAALMLARRDRERFTMKEQRKTSLLALVCFLCLVWTTWGVGAQIVFWGFLILLLGTPLYIWFKTRGPAAA
jgi:APA family basic amino acid/polyamine antiporter